MRERERDQQIIDKFVSNDFLSLSRSALCVVEFGTRSSPRSAFVEVALASTELKSPSRRFASSRSGPRRSSSRPRSTVVEPNVCEIFLSSEKN